MQQQNDILQTHPELVLAFVAYAFIAGIVCFTTVRRPFIHWYKSQGWLISGGNVLEIMFKQMGMRLTMELFSFGVACVFGAFGGWYFVFKRKAIVIED